MPRMYSCDFSPSLMRVPAESPSSIATPVAVAVPTWPAFARPSRSGLPAAATPLKVTKAPVAVAPQPIRSMVNLAGVAFLPTLAAAPTAIGLLS
ncbi:hypothetical protein D9M72_636400 [compost metagenome]